MTGRCGYAQWVCRTKLTTAGCCGYTVRTTRKWLDQGYPLCPYGQPIHEE